MVFGRKQEASDEGTEPLRHPKPPLASGGRDVQASDRHGRGCGRKRLYQRWLVNDLKRAVGADSGRLEHSPVAPIPRRASYNVGEVGTNEGRHYEV